MYPGRDRSDPGANATGSYACRSRVYLDQATRAIQANSSCKKKGMEESSRLVSQSGLWPTEYSRHEECRLDMCGLSSLSLPGVGIEALKQCCQEIGWDLEVDIEAVCRRTPSQAAIFEIFRDIRFIIREGVPAGRGLAMTPGIESRLVSSQAPAFFPSPSRRISPFSPDPWCHFLSRLKSTTNSHGHTGPEPVFSSYTRAYMQSSSPGHRWR